MRRRYTPASRVVHPPLVAAEGGNALPGLGALIPAGSVPSVNQQTPRDRKLPQPFDLIFIRAVPATGTLGTLLVGIQTGVNTPQLSAVPDGYRGIVDGIFPYLEGVGGVVSQPRIPGVVDIVWHLRLNGTPVPVYGAMNYILAPWNAMSDRALFEVPPGKILTCDVDYTDAFGLYTHVGIRIKGRLLPWSEQLPA